MNWNFFLKVLNTSQTLRNLLCVIHQKNSERSFSRRENQMKAKTIFWVLDTSEKLL